MANKFCVNITHSKDNTDKATVGFVVANAAVGSGKETMVFLSVEGVRLSQRGRHNQHERARLIQRGVQRECGGAGAFAGLPRAIEQDLPRSGA